MVSAGVVEILLRVKDKAAQAFKSARSQLNEISRGAKIAGTAITAFGVGGVLAIGKLVKGSSEVETAFAQVNTLLNEGQDAQELFGDAVKSLNVVLGNQGDQLTVLRGLYQTVSAGISDTADAQKFLEVASRAAVGGQAELDTVILAGTKAMASFGITIEDTERVFDVFAATVKAGQTTLPELANAFPRVAGAAGEMGLTLEETAGILAGLTKVMPSTEEAATSLNAVLTGLLKPTDDLKEVMGGLGYESGQAMIESLGLMGTLQILKGVAGDDAEAMGEMFSNVRALRAIFPALGKASGAVSDSLDIINDSAGLMNEQFEEMASTSAYQFGEAMSELSNVTLELGGMFKDTLAPILQDTIIPAIQKVKEWWDGLSDTTKSFIIKAALVATALALIVGPILLLIGFLPTLAIGISMVGGALMFLAANPVGLTIVAIVALIACIVLLWKNWDKIWGWIKEKTLAVWNWLKDIFFKGLDSKLMLLLGPIGAIIYAFRHWDEIKEIAGRVWNWIKDMAQKIWDKLTGLAGSALQWGKDLIGNFIQGMVDKFNAMWSKVLEIKDKIKGVIGYDVLANDLEAQRWGRDLIENFMMGMQSAGAGVGSVAESSVTNNMGGLTVHIENINAGNQGEVDDLFARFDEWQGRRLNDIVRF